MKAQSWRKILGLSNAGIVLGILATGAWYFTKVAPASADAAKPPKWTAPAFGQYQLEAKGARSQTIWPVDENLIKQIRRPDDWMNPVEKGGPFQWAYVGPIPPPKKVIEAVAPAAVAAAPTGLEVLGKPQMVYSQPGNDADPIGQIVVTWLFKDAPAGKAGIVFTRGDPFISGDEREKREKLRKELSAQGKSDAEIDKAVKRGRFKLKDGWPVPGSAGADRRVVIVYDIYDEATDTVVSANEVKEFSLASEAPKVDIRREGPDGSSGEASGVARAKPSLPDGVAPPLSEVKVEVRETSASSRKIEADENVFRYMKYTDPDKLLDDVKTEDAKDAAGNKTGVKVSGITAGSFASQFDVKPGDILKAINGTPVHSRSEAVTVVKAIPKETTNVQVVIERNGRQITYDVDPRDPKVRGAGGKVKFK